MKEAVMRRPVGVVIILLLLVPVIFFISINTGYTDLSVLDVLRIIGGNGTPKENLVVMEFRLPRIVLALLTGMGFSLSGCIMQGITRNPLADPGLIGINAGAGLVVITFITFAGTVENGLLFSLPLLSLVGATVTGGIIYKLSSDKVTGIQPLRLVLNGVAIQAGINAVMTLIVLTLDDRQHEYLAKWQAGNIWGANWELVGALLPWILAGYGILLFLAREMDILVMGDEIAKGLGIKVKNEKRKLLFTAIALAAACVAISGSISFVGLIAPHLSRKLVGTRHKILIPACALVGALLVLTADTIARVIIEPSEIPAGIVVSVIGAPYFLYLMIRNRKAARS